MTSTLLDLPADAARWIEGCVGGTVESARRFPRARDAWWVETLGADGSRERWLLKGRRAPAAVTARSRLLTDFGARREAAAMTALAGTQVRVPRLGGISAVSGLLLIEHVAGSALVHRAPLPHRAAAVADYGRQLATLHALNWQDLPIGRAIPVPLTATDMALGGWLRSAEVDAATAGPRLRHREPLLRLLVRWLHDSVPSGRDVPDIRLLHGDAGVTNFLSVDGRVTALLDWELAVLGDPMSDLGNARYREALYPSGTYGVLVDSYQDATDRPVDRAAIGYYTVLAASVLSLGMVANVHRPRASQPEVVARLWQDALARCVACEAVCEVDGVALDYGSLPTPGGSAFDALAELAVDRADRTSAQAGPIGHAYGRLARAIRNALGCGAAVDAALLADAGELTGQVLGSADDARARLDTMVAAADRELRSRVLVVLARDARRRLEVLAPLRDAEVWEDVDPAADPQPLPRAVLPALPTAPGGRRG